MQDFLKNPRNYIRSILFGVCIGIATALIFAAGFFLRDLVGLPPAFASGNTPRSDSESYPLLDEVQLLLNEHYLREQPNYAQRQYAAIRGMLASLEDRYTFFIDPPVAQSESDVLAGTYGGIGVEIQRSEAGDLLLIPFPGSPAEAAGIEVGDVLVAVNGSPVDFTLPQDALDQMLRGEVKDDNGVEISVIKQNEPTDEEYTVFIAFAVIDVPSVLWRVLDESHPIGYLRILRFTSRTPEELRTSLEKLRNLDISALIVDLRDNSGGLLQESIQVASQFLDDGVVLYEESSAGERALRAEGSGLATDLPLVVLVNQGTASAAELVAGAIRDNERGILVGQTTYGKGTVQQIFRLSDDSSVHITSAEWFTPDRHALDGVGLAPDIAMIPDENGRDVELGEAVRFLQQELQPQDEAHP